MEVMGQPSKKEHPECSHCYGLARRASGNHGMQEPDCDVEHLSL